MTAEWEFFVDESGRLTHREDNVVVAGLCVRCGIPWASPGNLRMALERAAPHLHWPFHAAYHNRPIFFALASYVLRNPPTGQRGASFQDPDADNAVVFLRGPGGCAAPLRTALARLALGLEPEHSDLRQMDNALRVGKPGVYRRLRKKRRRLHYTMKGLLREIGRRAYQQEDYPPGVMAFAASEAWQGSAWGTGTNFQAGSDRYFALLDALFARVCGVMHKAGRLRRGLAHDVSLHVLERDIYDRGGDVRVRLNRTHVDRVARKSCPEGRTVSLSCASVPQFQGNVHPLLVLADFVANRLYSILWGGALNRIEDHLNDAFGPGVWVRTGGPARTHLASAPHTANPPVGVTPREWAVEQAREWP